MPAIRIKISNEEVRRLFARLKKTVTNMRPVLETIAEGMFQRTRRAFERQRSPEGVPWRSLSRRYAQRKLKLFGPRKKLFASGELFRFIHRGLLPGNRGAFVATANLPYARIHQWGGRAGRGRKARIPARPYLVAQATAEMIAKQALEDALKEATRGR